MKKKLLSFLALFISLSIYFSCTDEGVEVSGLQRINPDSDLLAYAMNLVGENGEGCSLIDLQKGSTNSRTVTDYSTVATPLWDKAKTEHHGDEEVLIVPLQGEDDIYSSMYFEEEEMGRLYQTKSFSRLIVRTKNGRTITQVFTYLPGRNYAKNRQAVLDTMGFSPLAVKYYGTILISDLEGKFQQGYFYERGIPTIRLKAKQHTHTDACCSSDDTACDNHEHTINVRLKLSRNVAVASRSFNGGDEISETNPCQICNATDPKNCICEKIDGEPEEDGICKDCSWPVENCICPFKCSICNKIECTCYPCQYCLSKPCKCESLEDIENPKVEQCTHCKSYYCKGECQEKPKPEDDNKEPAEFAPKAKAIFQNYDLNNYDWLLLERMLNQITLDSLGNNLYNSIRTNLNGSTLNFEFEESEGLNEPMIPRTNANCVVLSSNSESSALLRELMYVYRAQNETLQSYLSAMLNGEIEALYAQYLYLCRQSELSRIEWESIFGNEDILDAVIAIGNVLNDKGQLLRGKENADIINAFTNMVEKLQVYPKYQYYMYDASKSGLDNFNNLRSLTNVY